MDSQWVTGASRLPGKIPLVGIAVVTFIIFRWVFKGIQESRSLPKSFNGRKCEKPPTRVGKYPFGIEAVLLALKATREQRLPLRSVASHEEFGHTFASRFLGLNTIYTRDPRVIQAVLATQFDEFGMEEERLAHHELLGTQGIFTQDGPQWARSRALIRPSFDRAAVADLDSLETHFQQCLAAKINAEPAEAGSGFRAVELQKMFQNLTMESSTSFLLGSPISKVSIAEASQEMSFGEAFDTAQNVIAMRLPLAHLYWLVNPKRFKVACAAVHSHVSKYVSRAIKYHNESLQNLEAAPKDNSSARKYVFLEALAEQTQDPQILQDQILSVMLAGRDTTASLLTWTFLCLANHPEKFQKLRQEISEHVGVGEEAKLPNQAELRDMTYLRWTLKEVLRLYPPVPFNARYSLKPTTLPYGGGKDGSAPISLVKGARVIYSVFALHRRKDIYGDDADDFRPERWGQEELRKVGWGWLPFNGGARVCLGQQMALTHASYFVTRMLQSYSDIVPQNIEEARDIKYVTTAVMACGRGVPVKLR